MSSSVETQKHTSLAEKLAASARQSQQSAVSQAGNAQGKALGSRTLQSSGSANIPARLEEALDVEGDIPINEVEVGGTVSDNRLVVDLSVSSSSAICVPVNSRSLKFSSTPPIPAPLTHPPTPTPWMPLVCF